MKKISMRALVLVLIFSVITGQVLYATELTKEATVISGVTGKITCAYKKELSREITVSPANGGRTVLLQKYSHKTEKYKTVLTCKTEDEASATVKITFPKEWRRRRTGTWRIVVEESDSAEEAVKNITVTTTNIVEKNLTSASACIYCIEDKQVIYGKLINKRRKQASTTKIMTATVLLESGKYGGKTKVSKKASKVECQCLNMKPGDVYTYQSLLYSLMLPSSNDAAMAIAEGVGGSQEGFAKLMNKKAKELGLKNTHFVTPHGLDTKNHYSSAYDICVIMGNIYFTNPTFRKVIATSKYSFTTKKYKQKKTVYTTDRMKGYSPKHMGGKTGYTSKAHSCFSCVYVHEGKTYVVTTLGAPSASGRWSDIKKLYKYIDDYAATEY